MSGLIPDAALLSAQVIMGLYLADFLSGIFHWLEDRYGDPNWPIIGHTIRQNQEHHVTPRKFLNGTLWTRNREVWMIAASFLAIFAVMGWLNPLTVSMVVFGSVANEVHGRAHRSPKENGRLITWLQSTGFIQSHRHHAAHHRRCKDTHFCVLTNHVNPVLEWLGFFPTLEKLIFCLTGSQPRPDPSVNPRYAALRRRHLSGT